MKWRHLVEFSASYSDDQSIISKQNDYSAERGANFAYRVVDRRSIEIDDVKWQMGWRLGADSLIYIHSLVDKFMPISDSPASWHVTLPLTLNPRPVPVLPLLRPPPSLSSDPPLIPINRNAIHSVWFAELCHHISTPSKLFNCNHVVNVCQFQHDRFQKRSFIFFIESGLRSGWFPIAINDINLIMN